MALSVAINLRTGSTVLIKGVGMMSRLTKFIRLANAACRRRSSRKRHARKLHTLSIFEGS